MLKAASMTGEAGCRVCTTSTHHVRTTFRRRVIATSSALNGCLTDARDEYKKDYKGLDKHVDVLSVPGGKVKDVVHALLSEIKQSEEPQDIALYVGVNDILDMKITKADGGFFFMDEAPMKTICQTLAILTRELLNSPLKHTLRCCKIATPPRVVARGEGYGRALTDLNKIFHVVNDKWRQLGVVMERGLDFNNFARNRNTGKIIMDTRAYKPDRLHLQNHHKLAFGIKIARNLGANTVPAAFFPPQKHVKQKKK